MFNNRDNAKRSPSESTLSESVREGSGNALTQHTSRLSSVSEDNKNSIILKLTRSTSTSSSNSQSETNPRPIDSGKNALKTFDDDTSQRSTVRQGTSNEHKKQNGKGSKITTAPSQSKDLISRAIALGTKYGAGNGKSKLKSKSAFAPTLQGGHKNQSIFEKVDRHNGHTTYLGSGSFSRLEDCIANCLSRDKPHTSNTHHTAHHDFPFKRLTRASVLEDYSYDGIASPHHHHELRSHSNQHHYSHHDHYSSDHKKSAAELSLNEIQQVNDALAKQGVPVFSHHGHHENQHHGYHHDQHHDQHHGQHHDQHHHHRPGHIGEILSACQLLLKDPTIASLRPGAQAVSHAWDAIQHHPPPTNTQGYPSSPVLGATSHLFGGPQQNSYNPVQGAASHLFGGGPPQNSYSPVQGATSHLFGGGPPQNSYNPVQGAASHLFGGGPPQNSYNPVQGAASHLFGGGPPQNSYNPVQGAASHLFGGGPPQNSYNPVQGAASHLFGGGPPQNSYNPVQGVASRLFG